MVITCGFQPQNAGSNPAESIMRTLIIADCHGSPWLITNALEHAGYEVGIDRLIHAGDITDIGSHELECIHILKENNAELLLGNHDLATLSGSPIWPQNPFNKAVQAKLTGLTFKVAAQSYGILITHAGLAKSFKIQNHYSIPGSYSDDLNHEVSQDELWTHNSPLWYRPTPRNMPLDIQQIVGHTPPEWIQKNCGALPNFISVDPYCSKDFDRKRYRYAVIEHGEITVYDSLS